MKFLPITVFILAQVASSEPVTYTFGVDVTYPPYGFLNPVTGEVEGFGKDVADGMTALCDDLNLNVVQTSWPECWNGSSTSIGRGLNNGTYDACMTYTNIKGVRNKYVDWSNSILNKYSKPAGLIVKLNADGLPEIVDGMDDLCGKIVVDVKGWAPTADNIYFVKNKCIDQLYSEGLRIIPNSQGANSNDEALRMVLDGTVDAMFVYADQADHYKEPCEKDMNQKWNCQLWMRFGEDFAYVQTGQFSHIVNGTTLAMTKKGSGVGEAVNPCLQRFLETKEYYDACVKHGLLALCFPNSYFPSDKKDPPTHPYLQETYEHTTGCADGYCSCTNSAAEQRLNCKNTDARNYWEKYHGITQPPNLNPEEGSVDATASGEDALPFYLKVAKVVTDMVNDVTDNP